MRKPKEQQDTLHSWFGKSVDGNGMRDVNYQYGPGCDRSDMRVLHQYLPAMLEELKSRGYDLETFRLTIKKKEGGDAK